jgi:arylsulfatase A-like enzyme
LLSFLVYGCGGESVASAPLTARVFDAPALLGGRARPWPADLYEALAGERVWILDELIEPAAWREVHDEWGDNPRELLITRLAFSAEEPDLFYPSGESPQRGSGRIRGADERALPTESEALIRHRDMRMQIPEGRGLPGPMSVDYPISADQISEILSSVDPWGAIVYRELSLRSITRRAVVAPTPVDVVYQVHVPSGALLSLDVGMLRLELQAAADAVRHRVIETARTFQVIVESEGADPVMIWEHEIAPEDTERFFPTTIPLGDYAGEVIRLRMKTNQPEKAVEGGPWRALAVWGEPILTSEVRPDLPNVVFIVLDTLRADRLGSYGCERARTPNLDAFAGRGVRFAEASSVATWTLPSHASMFTSTYPSQHGLWSDQRLSEDVVTLAEVLSDRGYHTAAFTESGFVTSKYGFARGFDSFDAKMRDCSETFKLAQDWIDDTREPLFAFVQTYQVHSPYDPPEPFRGRLVRPYSGDLPERLEVTEYGWTSGTEPPSPEDVRYIKDLYDAEVSYLDDQLGDFLRHLEKRGLGQNTLFVITSDHGEEFFEHGSVSHGMSLYEEQLHVPLLLYQAGRFEGGRVANHPVHLLDLAPTIALAADAQLPSSWEGVPLSIDGGEDRELFVPMLTFFTDDASRGQPASALREGSMKFVDYPPEQRHHDPQQGPALFDLSSDPHEEHNLLDGRSDEEWSQRVREYWSRFAPLGETGDAGLDEAALEELERLGYVGVGD